MGVNSSFTTKVEEVAGGHAFRSITCGCWHTCALNDAGQAWCWGAYCNGRIF